MSSPSETLEGIRKGTSEAPFLTSEQEWRVGVMLNRLQRVALSREIRGKYAHLPTSSESFAARKADEIALEERRR